MEIVRLFAYPVKSLQGEQRATTAVGDRGFVGDRAAALRDVATGVVLTGRRDPVLLFATGAQANDGAPIVRLPDGRTSSDAAELSAWIGRPVELTTALDRPSTYEINADFEDDDSAVETWQGPSGSFHDSARLQVSIIATGDIRGWDVRRFRPNVLVEADTVDHLVGHRVRMGTAELDVVKAIERCVMVTRPQPGGIGRDLDVLRAIHRERSSLLGVGGLVTRSGSVSVGDQIIDLGQIAPADPA